MNEEKVKKGYRYVNVQNPVLYDLFIKKERLLIKGRKITDEIEKLEQERNKYGLAIQKLKDQIIPLAKGITVDLKEFEDVMQVYIPKKGKKLGGHPIEIEVVDRVEEFKEILRDEKKKEAERIEANKNQAEVAKTEPEKPDLSGI